MKRIGVLLDRLDCDSGLADVIESLAHNRDVDLHLIVNASASGDTPGFLRRIPTTLRTKGFRRGLGIIAFALISGLELRLLSRFSARAARFRSCRDVSGSTANPIVQVKPQFSKSGLFVRYSDEDLQTLREREFDVLIRGNNRGILRGGILEVATDGILSFHHGDNSWNRGGPPAFWELYRRRASTGFVIQRLTEELDGGEVLVRGSFTTQPTYAQNLVHLLTESNVHLIRLIEDYARTGSLPQVERPMPHGEPLLLAPTLGQCASYVWRTGLHLTSAKLNSMAGREIRWQVAFVPRHWQDANLRKAHVIANPGGHFLADPFVVERDGRTICFVEDYAFTSRRAAISAVELNADGSYEMLGTVLEEPFHLSFPYVFEADGELYMAPEMIESRSVRIYRCADFPSKWEHIATALDDISASDPMIFQFGSKWWLFANVAPAGAIDSTSQLHLFHADEPLSGSWTPHRANPVIFDSLVARNAGLLAGRCGTLFRVSQRQGFAAYGAGFNIAEIVRLDEHGYEERVVQQIDPRFFPGIERSHHMHSNGAFTVFDFAKTDRRN